MSLKRRFINRLTGFLVRWGFISHPWGRDYAKENYTVTGKNRNA